MEKYNGLINVFWFISGFIWGNCLSKILGLDITWAIGGIALLVLVIVLITIIVVELMRD